MRQRSKMKRYRLPSRREGMKLKISMSGGRSVKRHGELTSRENARRGSEMKEEGLKYQKKN